MQVLVANTGIFTLILQEVLIFLVAKSCYQLPRSGSMSKYKVTSNVHVVLFYYTKSGEYVLCNEESEKDLY